MGESISARHEANSYVVDSLFFNLRLKTSIDYLVLTCVDADRLDLLKTILQVHGFECVGNRKLAVGNYAMKMTYRNDDGVSFDISYGMKESYSRSFLRLAIRHPNREFLSLLDAAFQYHGMHPTLSAIELTFDFFTPSPYEFREYLLNRLFLRHQRKEARTYKNTFYTNNLRLDKAGMRVYRKLDHPKPRPVRMELVLRRSVIRRHKLKLPLTELDSMDWSKFFSFKVLNHQKLRNHVLRENREVIMQADARNPRYAGLMLSNIDQWLDYVHSKQSLMKQVEVLKEKLRGVDNYSRFLESDNAFTEKFKRLLEGEPFVPSRQSNITSSHSVEEHLTVGRRPFRRRLFRDIET